jgi:hypothetical protein
MEQNKEKSRYKIRPKREKKNGKEKNKSVQEVERRGCRNAFKNIRMSLEISLLLRSFVLIGKSQLTAKQLQAGDRLEPYCRDG